MWNKLLALNSFALWPAAGIFMFYSAGHAVLTFEWKMLVVAVIVFVVFTIVEVVLALLSD